MRGCEIDRIEPAAVVVRTPGGVEELATDAVFVLIGADLPVELLAASGVRVQTHRGERAPLPMIS